MSSIIFIIEIVCMMFWSRISNFNSLNAKDIANQFTLEQQFVKFSCSQGVKKMVTVGSV